MPDKQAPDTQIYNLQCKLEVFLCLYGHFRISTEATLSSWLSLNMLRYTLSKKERLVSLKAIERLFKKGQSVTKYPVRLVWLEVSDGDNPTFPVQVMFSVSKKKFARAVDRNRIKRLLREGYRLNKPGFYEALPKGKTFSMAVIYTGTKIETQASIQKSIYHALENMVSRLSASR